MPANKRTAAQHVYTTLLFWEANLQLSYPLFNERTHGNFISVSFFSVFPEQSLTHRLQVSKVRFKKIHNISNIKSACKIIMISILSKIVEPSSIIVQPYSYLKENDTTIAGEKYCGENSFVCGVHASLPLDHHHHPHPHLFSPLP